MCYAKYILIKLFKNKKRKKEREGGREAGGGKRRDTFWKSHNKREKQERQRGNLGSFRIKEN